MPYLINNILIVVSGVAWIAVYILAIIRGSIDKTYAIPLPALMANVTWELIYGTFFGVRSPNGAYVPLVWLALDLPIFLQAMRYWRREFPSISASTFALIVIPGFATCFGILYFAEIERIHAMRYAFPQNLMMSILFIPMLLTRPDGRGQSIYIALFKMLGTGATIACAAVPIVALSGLDAVTFVGILFFDVFYCILLFNRLRQLGIQPWRRI